MYQIYIILSKSYWKISRTASYSSWVKIRVVVFLEGMFNDPRIKIHVNWYIYMAQ